MKRMFISVLLMVVLVLCFGSNVLALDWSVYSSNRNNIRLDGYDSQPGYIAFTGGDGVTRGYLFMNEEGRLHILPLVSSGEETTGAFDLTTTKITDEIGYVITDNR